MSNSSNISLGSLRQQCQEISDNENNSAITTEAWNSFITNSYKKLYDMLVSAFGNNYYIANYYQFTTSNSQTYSLPNGTSAFTDITGSTAAKFYKLTMAELQYSASPSGWITLRRFEDIEKNKYALPNTQTTWVGYTNLRYGIQGNNIFLAPMPQTGQTCRLTYIPAPTNLQFRLQGRVTGSSSIITFLDTSGLSPGMNITGIGINDNQTIVTVGTTSVVISSNAYSSGISVLCSMWDDSVLIDGISGWENFVIFDSALKSAGKQENDTSWLAVERQAMKEEIEAMAEARDAGQAFHVSDVMGANGMWGGDDFGGGGWGSGAW